MKPRRTPYTEAGIRRVPCTRCGKPSRFQWQVCADGNQWRGVCESCDIALNAVVCGLMFGPGKSAGMIARYIKKVGADQ